MNGWSGGVNMYGDGEVDRLHDRGLYGSFQHLAIANETAPVGSVALGSILIAGSTKVADMMTSAGVNPFHRGVSGMASSTEPQKKRKERRASLYKQVGSPGGGMVVQKQDLENVLKSVLPKSKELSVTGADSTTAPVATAPPSEAAYL